MTEALKLYREVIDQKNCAVINRFLLQFAALNHLIIAYNKARFSNSADQFGCICTLFEKEIDLDGREKIVSTIRKVGYDNLKNAFRIINQDCESELLEEGNLFFFLKKHRLKDYDIQSESDMLKYISYYLNVTIVNYNRINNLGTVYVYFKNKNEILHELRTKGFRQGKLKVGYIQAQVSLPLITDFEKSPLSNRLFIMKNT